MCMILNFSEMLERGSEIPKSCCSQIEGLRTSLVSVTNFQERVDNLGPTFAYPQNLRLNIIGPKPLKLLCVMVRLEEVDYLKESCLHHIVLSVTTIVMCNPNRKICVL